MAAHKPPSLGLARLETWRRLEGVGPSDAERNMYRTKVASFGPDPEQHAADLLSTVMALAAAWFSAPEALRDLTTPDIAHQRARVVDAVSTQVASEVAAERTR